jgi:hypothetical protein
VPTPVDDLLTDDDFAVLDEERAAGELLGSQDETACPPDYPDAEREGWRE